MRRSDRPLCSVCGKRPALFKYRGRLRWDRQHDMCRRCHRDEMNRQQTVGPKNCPSPAKLRRIYA